MRVGALGEPATLLAGARVRFARGKEAGAITVPHPQLYEAVTPGERLWLDDARLEVQVEAVDAAAGTIDAQVLRGGLLRPHKGLNRPDHPVPCPALSPRDEAMLAVALRHPFCEIAFSFVHDGREAELLSDARAAGRRLIAKIERAEAFEQLPAIAASFDELWLCRGDLGSQAGIFALAELQRRFADAHRASFAEVPTLLAGQVLEHLTQHAEPTRAEVVQLSRIADEGFSGIVLSDETAIGQQIDAVVRFLACWRAR
jgi:pyruvate kinase